MDVCCSFRSLVGGNCGLHRADENKIIPLLSCTKNISSHKAAFKFTGPTNEIELILCRASLFTITSKVTEMTICPSHRANLGLAWSRGANTRCRVPKAISGHGIGGKRWPKADRGLGREHSKFILKETGVFVQVGSGKPII